MNKIILLVSLAALFLSASAQKASGGLMDMAATQPMIDMTITSEAQYIAHMISHHQEAVDSALKLSETTERPELREFAQRIVETQREEIGLMQGWLATWYPDKPSDVAYTPMMRDSAQKGDASDRMFLEDMVMHHQMATATSQQLLDGNLTEHEEVAKLARAILGTQQSEIMLMQTWLRDWYGVAPMAMPMMGN